MDIEQKDDRVEKLRAALASIDNSPVAKDKLSANSSVESISSLTWDSLDINSIPAITTIDLSALNSVSLANPVTTISLGGSGGGGGGGGGYHYSPGTVGGGGPNTYTQTHGSGWSSTINADDVLIKGQSLSTRLERIEELLGILDCDQTLEKEWENLRRMGKEYRKLKKHIEDKMKTFETLKK
jgi:hypothetical protein